MRIVLVNDFYSPHHVGGAESAVRMLAMSLMERGHSPAVVTARIEGTEEQEILEGIPIFRIGRYPDLPKSIRLASGSVAHTTSPQATAEFERICHAFSADVIHFHNIWLLGPRLLKTAGFRKGITLHDYWPFCLRRSMMRVTEHPCPAPHPLACRLCQLRTSAGFSAFNLFATERRQQQLLEALKECQFFTAPSQYTAEQAHRFSGLPVQVIRNIIPPPAASDVSDRQPYVLFASRTTKIKGIDVLLEAFKDPELLHIHLKIAGNLPALKKASLNVEILGWKSPAEIARLISKAACVAVPSIWPENSPMLILEALNLGTPVIASAVGGIPELIQHGRTGLLVEPGSVKSLVQAVLQCLGNQPLQDSASCEGPVLIRQQFSPEAVISHLDSIYAGQ